MEILVAGANGGLGAAICQQLIARGHTLHTISRGQQAPVPSGEHASMTLSESSSVECLKTWIKQHGIQPDAVICCAGLLHNEIQGPEKALSQMSLEWLQQNMALNVAPSIHLAQALASQVNRRHALRWLSLSAMVGSIEDNQLGGWYSYRMSKAALNMFIRNLAIEWGRKSPDSIVSAIHPGTTDTALSKPFQATIAEGKLYSAELSSERICDVLEQMDARHHGRLLHWNGEHLPF